MRRVLADLWIVRRRGWRRERRRGEGLRKSPCFLFESGLEHEAADVRRHSTLL